MNKPITNEKEYQAALAELDTLFCSAEPNTPEGERLMELCDAVEKYELYDAPFSFRDKVAGIFYLITLVAFYYILVPLVIVKNILKEYINKKPNANRR